MKKIDALLAGLAVALVLFLNTYFNATSGVAINKEGKEVEDKFYLAGPDPYYNMRLVKVTLETGKFPYIGGVNGEKDPLLNYPLGGSGKRPPLFMMMAIGLSRIFNIFMNDVDAVGYSMQIIPAIFGALLVIPVYFIATMLFNRKAGIIASFIVALIPIHLSSGHGSAYSLFDHDSFVLLLTSFTMMFLVMSLKEKNEKKALVYACFTGLFIAALTMTWVASHYIYALVAFYGFIQMIVDIFTKKINVRLVKIILIALIFGYILSYPIFWLRFGLRPGVHFYIILGIALFSLIYLWIGKKNLPWLLSIPLLIALGGIVLTFLYFIKDTTNPYLVGFKQFAKIVFGKGIYARKVSLTIAEASRFDFSRTVMSFGPALFWVGWLGFFLLLYKYYKEGKFKKDYYLAVIVWFLVEVWLLSVAGRFINDLVPLMAIFSGAFLWLCIEKIGFASMAKSIKSIGGFRGIKRAVKTRHIAGAFILAFFVILPNSWLAFDASIPSTMKNKFNTDKLGAFGLGVYTEKYWHEAFYWLRQQTGNLSIDEKPAFISWWDYGFYCVAMAENPTVADNFQEGIPTAANFHTAQSEQEAVAVLIVRLAEGDMAKNGGKLSNDVKQIFEKYLGEKANDLVEIIENPKEYSNTTYGSIIGAKYGGKKYTVREDNARYHDAVRLILSYLDDENITMFYREMQSITGYSVRYYGVEGYDMNIFNVFTFLADKGVFGYETPEDDYFKLWYIAEKTGEKYEPEEVRNITETMSQQDIQDIYGRFIPYTERKDKFFKSMVYRVYIGNVSKDNFEYGLQQYGFNPYLPQLITPTAGLKHFVVDFISQKYVYYPRPGRLATGCPAVVIAKYYEGALLKGIVMSEGKPMEGVKVVVEQNVKIFNVTKTIPHDSFTTGEDGVFKVIAPAGNITLSFYSGGNKIKSITFNGTGKFAPITEKEATREEYWNSSTWTRDLGIINIEKGGIKGIVFWDKDGDGEYNASIDKPLKAKVMIGDIEVSTDSNGRYEVKKLLPKSYLVTAIKEGYDARRANVAILPNETIWHNISMTPSKVEVSGRVWYDENGNGKLDENETVPNVTVKFNLISAIDENARNTTATTDENGNYTISLYPSKYKVSVEYETTVGNETVRYTYEGIIDIKIGDKPKKLDIKLRRE